MLGDQVRKYIHYIIDIMVTIYKSNIFVHKSKYKSPYLSDPYILVPVSECYPDFSRKFWQSKYI